MDTKGEERWVNWEVGTDMCSSLLRPYFISSELMRGCCTAQAAPLSALWGPKVGKKSRKTADRIPRTGEPGGLPSRGSHRVGHD